MTERRFDSSEPSAADIAEYQQLRGEIDNRTQINNAIVAVELTAMGVGLASIVSYPDAATGIAAASAFLWMLWIDQAAQIWKLAAYISIEIAPRLRASHPGALGWETFMRRVDKGGEPARKALRISDTSCIPPSLKTATVGFYSSLLLGGAPLALLALGAGGLAGDMSGAARLARVLALIGSLAAWLAAFYVYRRFRSFRSVVDLAIEASASAVSVRVPEIQEQPSTRADDGQPSEPAPSL